jgi:hypothetical protein
LRTVYIKELEQADADYSDENMKSRTSPFFTSQLNAGKISGWETGAKVQKKELRQVPKFKRKVETITNKWQKEG